MQCRSGADRPVGRRHLGS